MQLVSQLFVSVAPDMKPLKNNKGRVVYSVVKLERKIEVVENDFPRV